MVPVLFRVGGVEVRTHGFFVLLGLLTAVGMLAVEARRRGMHDVRLVYLAAGGLFGGAVAAKVSTTWQYLREAPDPSLAGAWLQGGKSVLGGLAGAYVGVLVTKRLVGWKGSTGDLFAPAVALGMAIGRWGCFLTERPGTPTSLPWGVHVSPEAAARIPDCEGCVAGLAMHPSFLYEIAFHLAAFAVLLWWRDRPDKFKGYLVAYGLFRFGVEFVRGNPDLWHGLSGSQVFLIPALALMGAAYVRRRGDRAWAVTS